MPGCSEENTLALARELAVEIRPGDRVFLEGPLGAGKTTFARALLSGLGVHQPPEGSPTFAIAHEYDSPKGNVVHLDLYRLRTEEELEQAGVSAYFWEREAIVLVEWISLFTDFAESIRREGRIWDVALEMDTANPVLRTIRMSHTDRTNQGTGLRSR